MLKTFTVITQKGRPDSLKQAVKIAFTVVPDEPNGPSHPYNPIAQGVTLFKPDCVQSTELYWQPQLFFMIYASHGRDFNFMGPGVNAQPGQAVTLMSSSWSSPVPCSGTSLQPSIVVTNNSGSKKSIILAPVQWQVAYQPLENGGSITIPSTWKLQAYIVEDTVTRNSILQPLDLRRPVFPIPVLWDSLLDGTKWILSQDNTGVIWIHSNEPISTKPVTAIESLSNQNLLSEVLKRLDVMEKSIGRMQDDYVKGQTAMDAIRNQLSALEEAVGKTKEEVRTEVYHSITVVEAKANTLAGSFDQSQDRLSAVHEAVTDTQDLLADMERSNKDLNYRLPLVESKAEKAVASLERLTAVEELTGRTQNSVTTVEKAVHQTQDHVSLIQRMILAKQTSGAAVPGPLSPPVQATGQDSRIPLVEGRVEILEKSVLEQRKALKGIDRRIPLMEKLESDLALVQVSVTTLNRRVDAVEARSGDDEAGMEGPASSSSIEGSPVMFPNHLPERS